MTSTSGTTSAPAPATHAAGLIHHPAALLHSLDQIAATWATPILGDVITVISLYVLVRARIRERRNRSFAQDARVVEISAPPEAPLTGGEALWANLLGLHRPRTARLLHGQPHVAFEYCFTPDGHTIRLWVPARVPPGLVEHAIEAAWPGARTTVADHAPPPVPVTGAVAQGGRLVPARTDAIPIRSKHEHDPLRALFGAVSDLRPGEAACVQVIARPASARRARALRRTLNSLLGKPTGATGLKARFFNSLTPGKAPARTTTGPAPWRDPRTDADARAAAGKLAGPLWEAEIRYAAAAPTTHDDAAGRARGLAHAVASSSGVYAERNHLRRRHLRHPAHALAGRRFARGALYSIPEIAALAHLPADLVVPGLVRAGARPVPPSIRIPAASTPARPAKPLGDADTGQPRPVAIPVADTRHHLHVIGATGSGKSTFMANLILDDVHHGRGVVAIDPKGDLITDLLDRLPAEAATRTVLVDPDDGADPPRINMFDGADPDVAVDNLVGIFKRIYAGFWGPRTDDLLRATCLTLLTAKNIYQAPTIAHIPPLLTSTPARRRAIAALPREGAETLRTFWSWWEQMSEPSRAHAAAPLLNKLRAFLLRDFVAKTVARGTSTLDITTALDGGVCLVRLPKGVLGDETVRLLGSFVVAKTWQAASARARLGRPRHDAALYVDEAHNFLTLPYGLEEMLAEARAYRLSMVLAHQNLAQLPGDLREGLSANARSKIYFSVSPEDARQLERHTLPTLRAHDLSHLAAYQAAARLVVDAEDQPAFTLATRPAPRPVPGRADHIRTAARRNAHPPAGAGTGARENGEP